MKQGRRLWAIAGMLFVAPAAVSAGATVETKHLVVVDGTGRLSKAELGGKADQAQALLDRILAFWAADPGIDRFGKIKVEFAEQRRDVYSCVFFWETKGSRRTRVVQVFGMDGLPHMMAHKLTSAVFPNPDKLIRNIMGTLAEDHLGNPLTFPACGLRHDDWVLAILGSKSYIPLDRLGPDHESWGMKDGGGGKLTIQDKDKQHRAYAEAGSFGGFLNDRFGISKIKQFHRLSHQKERPWQEVFGAGMEELEKRWLETLKAREKTRAESVAVARKLRSSRADSPCAEAQRLAPHRP